jgi:hypothetical protein
MGKGEGMRRGFERLQAKIPQHPPFGGSKRADGYIAQGEVPKLDVVEA